MQWQYKIFFWDQMIDKDQESNLASISTGSFSITFWSRWARRMGFLPEKMLAIYVT